jgi:arginase family enzyme
MAGSLARSEFAACGAAGEIMLAGGLTWQQLAELGVAALHSGGCAGWSLSIYHPDLDPDHGAARSIVEFVARIAPSAGR